MIVSVYEDGVWREEVGPIRDKTDPYTHTVTTSTLPPPGPRTGGEGMVERLRQKTIARLVAEHAEAVKIYEHHVEQLHGQLAERDATIRGYEEANRRLKEAHQGAVAERERTISNLRECNGRQCDTIMEQARTIAILRKANDSEIAGWREQFDAAVAERDQTIVDLRLELKEASKVIGLDDQTIGELRDRLVALGVTDLLPIPPPPEPRGGEGKVLVDGAWLKELESNANRVVGRWRIRDIGGERFDAVVDALDATLKARPAPGPIPGEPDEEGEVKESELDATAQQVHGRIVRLLKAVVAYMAPHSLTQESSLAANLKAAGDDLSADLDSIARLEQRHLDECHAITELRRQLGLANERAAKVEETGRALIDWFNGPDVSTVGRKMIAAHQAALDEAAKPLTEGPNS